MSTTRRLMIGATAAALLLAPVACSDDGEETTAGTSTTATAAPDTSAPADDAVVVGDVTITEVWARATPPGMLRTAVYMDLASTDGDALIDVAVDPSVAADAQIHETVMADDAMGSDTTMGGDMAGDDMSSTTAMGEEMSEDMTSETTMGGDMGGEMTMQEVDQIDLPAGEVVSLAPGGYHVMLLDLTAELAEGDEIEVTLTFEKAGEVTVTAPVRQP